MTSSDQVPRTPQALYDLILPAFAAETGVDPHTLVTQSRTLYIDIRHVMRAWLLYHFDVAPADMGDRMIGNRGMKAQAFSTSRDLVLTVLGRQSRIGDDLRRITAEAIRILEEQGVECPAELKDALKNSSIA